MVGSRNLIALQVANILAFLLTLLINGSAASIGLNGKTTGQISEMYPTLITPANYTFQIWGIIYILLLIFVVFQALPKQREKTFIQQIGILFVLSGLLNIVWLFLWHYGQIVVSVAFMFALLATLIAIYLRLQIGKSSVLLKEKLLVHLPFSVYLGWITVASIANVATALTSINVGQLLIGNVTWAILVIAVALIITLLVIATRRDIAYSLVLIWALVGIMVKQSATQSVVLTSGIGAAIIAAALVVLIVSRLRK